MFTPNGLRASELAAQLAELIEEHGDCRVVANNYGRDEPYDVDGIAYQAEDNGYYKADNFVVH